MEEKKFIITFYNSRNGISLYKIKSDVIPQKGEKVIINFDNNIKKYRVVYKGCDYSSNTNNIGIFVNQYERFK